MGTDEYRRQLYLQLHAGRPFTEIESWIEALSLSEDTKAGLWLLAWAEQDRPSQRRIADEALLGVVS
jgi:hypothetical protein